MDLSSFQHVCEMIRSGFPQKSPLPFPSATRSPPSLSSLIYNVSSILSDSFPRLVIPSSIQQSSRRFSSVCGASNPLLSLIHSPDPSVVSCFSTHSISLDNRDFLFAKFTASAQTASPTFFIPFIPRSPHSTFVPTKSKALPRIIITALFMNTVGCVRSWPDEL
jgi:hypothetical protein